VDALRPVRIDGNGRKFAARCAIAVFLMVASPAWGDYEDGENAYDLGDYATAYREWLPLAQQGNAEAQGKVGGLYEHGRGVARNDREAVKWYRRAADQGYAHAQWGLGRMYAAGRRVSKDPGEAAKWLRRAAEQDPSYATLLGID
jgi:uncharacterized protein